MRLNIARLTCPWMLNLIFGVKDFDQYRVFYVVL